MSDKTVMCVACGADASGDTCECGYLLRTAEADSCTDDLLKAAFAQVRTPEGAKERLDTAIEGEIERALKARTDGVHVSPGLSTRLKATLDAIRPDSVADAAAEEEAETWGPLPPPSAELRDRFLKGIGHGPDGGLDESEPNNGS